MSIRVQSFHNLDGHLSKTLLHLQPKHLGMWRSSVACLHGVQEVAGSNPVIPTLIIRHLQVKL